jgi:hypothetical protein
MALSTKRAMQCPECGFTTHDIPLFEHHNCDVQSNGGFCEDYPACGHEFGDCNGKRYGSDESIKARYYEMASSGMSDEEIDMQWEREYGD